MLRQYFWIAVLTFAAFCHGQETHHVFRSDATILSRDDLQQILGRLCPGKEFIGKESGCHVCPEITAFKGEKQDLEIETAYFGHFLSPTSDDLLVGTYGCTIQDGRSHLLFTRSAGRWLLNEDSDLGGLGLCRKIRNRHGVDGLLCYRESHRANGNAVLSFAYERAHSGDRLMEADDNRYEACEAAQNEYAHYVVVQSTIEKVDLRKGLRGRMTLHVYASCRRGLMSKKTAKVCDDSWTDSGTMKLGDMPIVHSPPLDQYRIDYVFDGEEFSVAKLSRASLEKFSACAVETSDLNGMW